MKLAKIPAACLAATLSLGLMMSPAQAGNDLTISYDRDALSSKSGAKAQLRKIERQVKSHCQYRSGPQPVRQKIDSRICVQKLMTRTVSEINHSRLSSVFENSQYYAGSFNERG